MRRWLATPACLAVLTCLASLAGCGGGLPEGVDGDLTNHWETPVPALAWRPLTGVCFDEPRQTAGPDDYAPISCDEGHLSETYHVGDLEGPAARAAANQGDPSAAQLAAYRECSRAADGFVNGRWRTGLLAIEPVLPDSAGWAGGARWFRCDIGEADDEGELVGRVGSLRLALDDPSIRLGCFNPSIEGEEVTALNPVDCDRPHHAEFAGLWTAPKMSRRALNTSSALGKGCLSTIARYTKVPDDSMMKYRTGWLGFGGSDVAWRAGDRSVQCFLWLSRETITGSYRGAGPEKLRIHYA